MLRRHWLPVRDCPAPVRPISVGCFLGFERKFAVRYSFIMSIPAVLGANILSLKDALGGEVIWKDVPVYLLGVLVAAVVGYACIRLLKMIAAKGKFGAFAYYCWAVGLLTVILTLGRGVTPSSVGLFGTSMDFSICGGFDRGFHITEENNKKNSGKSGSRTTAKSQAPRPIRREVGGVVCLVLALCVFVSYFGISAIFIDWLAVLIKGLLGYGYWLFGPALVLAGCILLCHHGPGL